MSNNGQKHLQESIEKIIEHCCMEYDMTSAELLGVLEIVKMDILDSMIIDDGDDEEEDQSV